jgi:hypothetical protein
MESNYSNKEFEHYVKQNADQYRMFPSDKVWKSINNTLHTRRKWYGFWLGSLLLLTGAAVTWVMTTQPGTKGKTTPILNNTYTLPADDEISAEETSAVIAHLNPFNRKVTNAETISLLNDPLNMLPAEITIVDAVDIPEIRKSNLSSFANIYRESLVAENEFSPLTSLAVNNEIHYPAESFNADKNGTPASKKTVANMPPYTIESVTNSYEYKRPLRRISWQIFITPTISYRKLSVNKSMDNPSALNFPFASLSDVNNAVTHKPDMGLQIGLSGRYPITRNLRLRGGIQFNINRYDIKAYAFNGEVATIDLNGGSGNSSISTWTYYRNYAGYKSDWLKNYYFSLSAPFGAELKLFGNKKTNFGIAGTLQPTYIIKDRAYLISTDYKNYAEVPRLIRHVNLNTSFETFVNYTNGKTKWQIGPQVRYQVLSSFHSKYPVKENLFDFGVKIGVTLNE